MNLVKVVDHLPVHGGPVAADLAVVGHLGLDVVLAHVVDQVGLHLEGLDTDAADKLASFPANAVS